jgi:glucose/arabinose dehydrogenase
MKPPLYLLGVLLAFSLCTSIYRLGQNYLGLDISPPTPQPPTPLPTFSVSLEPSDAPATPMLEATSVPAVVSLPDPDAYEWVQVADGFNRPILLLSAQDGSGRLFVVEQAGVIWALSSDGAERDVFMDISPWVTRDSNEQGLLGMAFDPDFLNNGYFYLHYSDLAGDTVLSRYRVSADPNVADPATELQLFTQEQPYENHNGGMIAFGPDGYLYMGLGDGGSGGDPLGNGQSTQTYLGKMLRMDVSQGAVDAPADNPLAGSAYPLIFHWGLRNPWRFSFDNLTGDLYIGDVGQNRFEEINFVPAGASGLNFGWDFYEGLEPFEGSPPAGLELVAPVATYGRQGGCSVSGGVVYRGTALPELQGVYFYADYCEGLVWGLVRDGTGAWQNRLLWGLDQNIPSFGSDAEGEVYIVTFDGHVLKLTGR